MVSQLVIVQPSSSTDMKLTNVTFTLNDKPMKTLSVILEEWDTNKLTFVTIEECIDMDDCINHIHEHFPSHTIEQITLK